MALRICRLPTLLLLTVVGIHSSVTLADDYERQIKPVLRERCYSCHGALKQEAGLRLDTGRWIRQGSQTGAVIVAGQPEQSLLLQRVRLTDAAERMPPEGEPLTPAQITQVQEWIAAGAVTPDTEQGDADPRDHWSFRPVVRPAVPRVESDSAVVEHPIDAFLQKRRDSQGLGTQPEASRGVLLRRLHLDLTGLPPTLEEINACEADPASDWYERTVRRLLADPRHGERWGRHWMDVWRYSDWWGLGDQLRNSQKHIWHWRDWIVESLNADTPYDEMIRQMLAADELYPNDLQRLRATGYLARNYWLFNRPQWMEETVEHVSKGFLGLTMACARCHDHKYDPIPQTDFYRLRAFFEPYHVRVDIVPGETDPARNGIPRAFDGLLEEPTWLYIRGDERNPDKSRVLSPGVPEILAFDELRIQPVTLPVEAWQPERRPWVGENHLVSARTKLQQADMTLQQAQSQLAVAVQTLAEFKPSAVIAPQMSLVSDDFQTLDTTEWKLFGGDWRHQPGRLSQQRDGAQRAALRWLGTPPQDFEATLRFTIRGGSKWRSVGLAFDVTTNDPSATEGEADSEQNVYVSAVSGGSKLQVAWHRGGQWQYPGGTAMRQIPVPLDEPCVLRVRVRGSLINAAFDDGLPAVFESPLPRRPGAIQLTTFDALVDVQEFTISALDPAAVLLQPSDDPETALPVSIESLTKKVRLAEDHVAAAEAALTTSRASLESISRRIEVAALNADPQANETTRMVVTEAAVRAERELKVALAREQLLQAGQAAGRATADQRDAAAKTLQSAQDMLEKALADLEKPITASDTVTGFVGAAWTPTRFFNSGKDDPEVRFPAHSSGRRSALAAWITDRRNPLTARVAVNHIWTRHMGQPLVNTMFDFGRKGSAPTHPELLDWLASEFMDSGWSMKHLHTLIVTSRAYRLSSSAAGAEDAVHADPENQSYWRRSPIRLESQVIRDSLLFLAGTLDETRGGPPVLPDAQAASLRRSLYFFHSNNERNLFLTTFDEALVKDCYRREQSIVPQQALALSNSELVLNAAEQVAARLRSTASDQASFVRDAFRLLTGIPPNAEELRVSLHAMETWQQLPQESAETARVHFIWVLMNHNDFVTQR